MQSFNPLAKFKPPEKRVVAYSPDGRLLAVTAARGKVDVWDVVLGEKVCRLKSSRAVAFNDLAFSRDGSTSAARSGPYVVERLSSSAARAGAVAGALTGGIGGALIGAVVGATMDSMSNNQTAIGRGQLS